MKKTTVKINETKSWFFEDKQNQQTFSQTHQEKKREESNQQNEKWKRGDNNRQCRNTKDYNRLLLTNIQQKNG